MEPRLPVPHRQPHNDNEDRAGPDRRERLGRQRATDVFPPDFRASGSVGASPVVALSVQKQQMSRKDYQAALHKESGDSIRLNLSKS
jgi:hypothetical protein